MSPSGKDACLFHPGNGDAITKFKSTVDIVSKTQRELNFSNSSSSSSSSSSNTAFWFMKSLFEQKKNKFIKRICKLCTLVQIVCFFFFRI